MSAAVAAAALFMYALYRFRGAVLTFYFLDDFWVMRDAARIDLRSIWDVTQFLHFGHAGFFMYRPLSTTAYAYVLHALFGYDSSGYHAAQLLVFGFNVCLVFEITRRLVGSVRAGLAVGLLYLLAPGQAVDAYWLSAFTVTGTAVWLLLQMWAWIALASPWRTAACTLFQVLGLLASEHAAVGPILCGVLAAGRREPWRRSVGSLAPATFVVAVYALAKAWYLLTVRSIAAGYEITLDLRIWIEHLGHYLVACFNLLTLLQVGAAAHFVIGLAIIVILLLACWYARHGDQAWGLLAAAIVIYAVSLAPVLVLRTHYKDHYVCLPAFGAALAVLAICRLATRHWRWLGLGVATSLLLLDLATGERAWRHNEIFRLVVNGSNSSAAWVQAVQTAGRPGVDEVLVPTDAIMNSTFAMGQFHTYFPGLPAHVTRYPGAAPPAPGPRQAVVKLPAPRQIRPRAPDHPAPGWEARWDWLRRLAMPPP